MTSMRAFLALLLATVWLCTAYGRAQDSRQATGVKVGEVTDTSAIVWMRLTAAAERKGDGVRVVGAADRQLPAGVGVDDLEGACPGAAGQVRLRYGLRRDLSDAESTAWVPVVPETDFTHQFRLVGLTRGTTYHFAAETAGPRGGPAHAPLRGSFQTAPRAVDWADVTFTVITGQMYKDLDDPDGFRIYEAMGDLKPQFIVPTGDTVYYDNEAPRATTVSLARYHWHRMYSLPRHIAFHLQVPGYWEKDDHDTLSNDCWPTLEPGFMLPMTFPDGQRIFREQAPMGGETYRTYRWGKGLQIWLVEGRDSRSPNNMPDGPDKTIWGPEQKEWLKRTILASDADWKVLLSPTPIVGPDRTNKRDNHANAAFAHEGNEFRRWVQQNAPDNLFLCCGDRHWQYHSVHPDTGVHEFCSGPASDQHAGGTPGRDDEYHRFHLVKGGFLSVSVGLQGGQSTITFRHHDVQGEVVYEYERKRAAGA